MATCRPAAIESAAPEDYDRALCLLPRDVVDFVLATQPKEWQKLAQHHGAAVREQFLKRLAAEIERRGALDVLRNGIKDSGCKFQLAYFRPASGLNEETRRLHAGEPVRRGAPAPLQREEREQPRPRAVPERHPDLHRRAEEPAHRPRRRGRDPAVQDRPRPARAAPRLRPLPRALRGGSRSGLRDDAARRAEDALPALQPGQVRRRRQPAVPPTQKGYATGYLWEETWARDSVLDLVRQFIHEVEEEDEQGPEDRQALPDLPALSAARRRPQARSDARARRALGSAT